MKKIYLKEILDDILVEDNFDGEISYEASIKAMKEAIRQALELASENAKCKTGTLVSHLPIIDKQSILDTIKQIEP